MIYFTSFYYGVGDVMSDIIMFIKFSLEKWHKDKFDVGWNDVKSAISVSTKWSSSVDKLLLVVVKKLYSMLLHDPPSHLLLSEVFMQIPTVIFSAISKFPLLRLEIEDCSCIPFGIL